LLNFWKMEIKCWLREKDWAVLRWVL